MSPGAVFSDSDIEYDLSSFSQTLQIGGLDVRLNLLTLARVKCIWKKSAII